MRFEAGDDIDDLGRYGTLKVDRKRREGYDIFCVMISYMSSVFTQVDRDLISSGEFTDRERIKGIWIIHLSCFS
jgi:hypothetical protein